MNVTAWDIETAPDDSALADYLIDGAAVDTLLAQGPAACTKEAVEAATEALCAQNEKGWRYGQTKDPALLYEKLRRDYAALVEGASRACSIDPLRGRIVSVAFAGRLPGETPFGAVKTLADFDGDEAQLLRWTWRLIGRCDALVTWNGVQFDARFLHVRSALLGVPPARILDTPRGRYAPVCDLMQWLAGWERTKFTGLDAACRRTGIGQDKGGMDGSQVAGLVQDGRWDEVAQYNLGDVLDRTWPLYERFAMHIPGHEVFGRALADGPAPAGEEKAA